MEEEDIRKRTLRKASAIVRRHGMDSWEQTSEIGVGRS